MLSKSVNQRMRQLAGVWREVAESVPVKVVEIMILPAHHCTGAVAGRTGMRGRRHLPRPSYSLLLHLDYRQTAIARATIKKKKINCL